MNTGIQEQALFQLMHVTLSGHALLYIGIRLFFHVFKGPQRIHLSRFFTLKSL